MHVRALALCVALLAAATLAGCTGRPDETVQAGGNVEPSPVGNGTATPGARFEVAGLEILRADRTPGPLHEDDHALIRYTIREPADAPKAETAFVTYLLDGRIIDTQQLKLEPGEERTIERTLLDLHALPTISVEVRAASSVQRASSQVLAWPRAGAESLFLGPLEIRADYGLMEKDGRVLVNLTIANGGPEQELRDLRAKMLCELPNGTIRATNSVRIEPPPEGTTTTLDVLLDDCGAHTRYGIELKAHVATGDIAGRLLLVH